MEQYFIQSATIDDTIKEADLENLFSMAINTTTRYEINNFNEIWSLEDLEKIINHDLFYARYQKKNQIAFYLKNTDSPWALKSSDKQKFSSNEIQKMFLDQAQLNVEWSNNEKRWKIKSLIVHTLSDIFDNLQLFLINKQYEIDRLNATNHRAIDCSDWSTICTCQSAMPAIVFTSNTHLVRIPSIDLDFSSTGFTIELWVRPDSLPSGKNAVQLVNFRGEYCVTYQPKGEITFSVITPTQTYLYTTSLQAIPLNQWTFLSFVYSVVDKQLQLYVNGDFVSSIILSIKPKKLNDDLIIGQEFIGAVRDLRLWGCARNADEIRFSMNTNSLIGNETCLVGLWPMADGNGQNILDLSLNGIQHSGTLGIDDNPNLYTNPIWVHVLPKPPPPPEPRILTWQVFRTNITLPMTVRWGSIVDIAV